MRNFQDTFETRNRSFISAFSICMTVPLNQIRHCLTGHNQIWHYFFIKKYERKYFNDLQNQNFSVLWLKWTQTMEIKQNQTFFHGTYSNPTPHPFLSKNIEVFPWISKLKFLNFMTKVKSDNGNETKSDIFP